MFYAAIVPYGGGGAAAAQIRPSPPSGALFMEAGAIPPLVGPGIHPGTSYSIHFVRWWPPGLSPGLPFLHQFLQHFQDLLSRDLTCSLDRIDHTL